MTEFFPSIWHLFKTNTNEHSNKVDDEILMPSNANIDVLTFYISNLL